MGHTKSFKKVLPGLYQISLGNISRGPVNAFIISGDNKLTVIDTGYAGDGKNILSAVHELGHQPADINNILVTHAHYDHSGGLAALKEATNAPAWMHPIDAELVRNGRAIRPQQPTPGLINKLFCRIYIRGDYDRVAPAKIEHEVKDGQDTHIADGLTAIHIPGHCAGQLAFIWPKHGGVLFAGDAAIHAMGLWLQPTHENLRQGKESLKKLSALEFEVAVFGHGNPIMHKASDKFKKAFG